jgi:capsular polysaccharide transport system permease protein
MPPATFIVTGLIPWYLFSDAYGLPNKAITRNRRLLAFPIVSEFDLILGAACQQLVTYGIMFVLGTTISSAIEGSPFPRAPFAIMLLVLSSWLLGLFLGLALMPINRAFEPIEKFIGFFMRFGLLLSGVFLPITFFPEFIWPYLDWNPMLHVEELIHVYWFPAYHSPVASTTYLIEWLGGLAVLGLLCERYARLRLPVR